jgi:hypothetical protein
MELTERSFWHFFRGHILLIFSVFFYAKSSLCCPIFVKL